MNPWRRFFLFQIDREWWWPFGQHPRTNYAWEG